MINYDEGVSLLTLIHGTNKNVFDNYFTFLTPDSRIISNNQLLHSHNRQEIEMH